MGVGDWEVGIGDSVIGNSVSGSEGLLSVEDDLLRVYFFLEEPVNKNDKDERNETEYHSENDDKHSAARNVTSVFPSDCCAEYEQAENHSE